MERLRFLFKRYINCKISKAEFDEFWQMLNEKKQVKYLDAEFKSLWIQIPAYSKSNAEWDIGLKNLISDNNNTLIRNNKLKFTISIVLMVIFVFCIFMHFTAI